MKSQRMLVRGLPLGRWARGVFVSGALLLWPNAAFPATAAAERLPQSASVSNAPSSGAYTGSLSCRECHPKFYELWSTSFHGLAMQPYTSEVAQKLRPHTNDLVAGKYRFRADIARGVVIERGPEGEKEYKIAQTTGGKNVFYFLTQLERGHLQTLPAAYDVRRQEWFDTTASAVRHFDDGRRDEALYWKERPLTFNSSCYNCHVSQLEKNYDLGTDSYRTIWAEPGINCETCHGPGEQHVELFRNWPTNKPPPADLKLIVTKRLSIAQRNDMCGPCHAKMSPVTPSFSPGEKYFDHFDLVCLENPDFYPDGRDLGENYTFTQWLMNPCAKSGKLDCVHCHTSSGRYRFHEPAKANDACMPCHEGKVKNAPAHTHHPAGARGNLCISCHMPMTEFARMRRSDHSLRPPAPAATERFGSPNACNICHTNKTPAWADQKVRKWRSRDYQKPLIETASLVQAARKGDWSRLQDIISYMLSPGRDEVVTASLVRLLAACENEAKWPAIRKLMDDPSPLVQSSAADQMSHRLDQENIRLLAKAASDDFRLVRVRAASALAAVPEEQFPEAARTNVRAAIAELVTSMNSRPDDMSSHYNLGNFYMSRGEMQKAIDAFDVAIKLRPDALPPRANAAIAYNALGQNDKAEASLCRALAIEPTNAAVHLNFGMLLGEMQKVPQAEQEFRAALKSDPKLAAAAYNLALIVSKDHPEEAMTLITRAATLRPDEPRYTYTLALFQSRAGNAPAAIATLEKALERSPAHPQTYALLAHIYEEQKQPAKARAVLERAIKNEALPEEIRSAFAKHLESF